MDTKDLSSLSPKNNPYLIGHAKSESLIIDLYNKDKLNKIIVKLIFFRF